MNKNQVDVILGIPVIYDVDSPYLADSRGFFKCKRIVVSPAWLALSWREAQAVLYHEVKHCLDYHMEKRVLGLPLIWSAWWQGRCRKHELDCDRFAAENGFGVELARVIRHYYSHAPGPFYPSAEERCARLTQSLRENFHEVAA